MEGRRSLHSPVWTSQRALQDNVTGVMAGAPSAENNRFLEVVIQRLQEAVSREDLQLLVTHDGTWDTFVAMTNFSRDEADALREALNECIEDTDENLWATESLNEFAKMRMELQRQIAQLYALADKIDKIHRKCAISNVMTSSTQAVSGVLSILGLALAPVTAGGSLLFSATGMGLGAMAAMTSVATTILGQSRVSSAKAEARCLVTNSKDRAKETAQSVGQAELNVILKSARCINALKSMKRNIHALKLVRVNPHLLDNSSHFMKIWKIFFRKGEQVQKAFGGTAIAMSKGARIMGAAATGLFLLMDVYNLVQDSKHLQEGSKAESAEELRQQARVLEQKFEELIQIEKSLESDLLREPIP
ncbi:apolipoprotein L3 isoform X2 [Fukomys damarensis]|uniref:apolipoprotein L3 isoform X2 n=1 Tax=Fukomys damarensis TaxID=885580 RepID=UPI00053FA579|nr:apolipoprotein L3 isoform X2 [Fukomys damarensis]